jgi:hypothetical protein
VTIDEFVRRIEDRGPPLVPEDLAAFEREIGHALPEDYRAFLETCNGGYAGGRFWFRGPTPEDESADAGVNDFGGLRDDHGYLSLREARETYQGEEDRIPRSLIWIADDPFGNAICLGLDGLERGRIYFWDHENEPDPDEWDGEVDTAGNLQLLAESFSEFVAGLREPEDDDGDAG